MTDNTAPIPGLTPERVREITRELVEPITRGDLVETMVLAASYIATFEQRIVNLEQDALRSRSGTSTAPCICDGSGWKRPTLEDPTLAPCRAYQHREPEETR